ncbi:tumor protein D53 isoform X2 [Myripristis murdjan]|uniref:tumor protein D53 isoform X2 n=1 Tax=Myripristis murdjan TaxID=586833 RepID=UPI0011763FE0|nr:tumor protein D53 isoform X2 [Myripristis murdjan]
METRQQELYSSVLSDAVVDWGHMGPGEEWVNTPTHGGEQGWTQGTAYCSGEESVIRSLYGEDSDQMLQNGEHMTERTATHREEQGKTSPAEGDGTSPHLGDECVMATTWDMHLYTTERGHLRTGLLDAEPFREADEDIVSEVNLNNSIMTEEEREEIQQELAKLEEEINTLKQVLSSKEKQHAELKQKLGITPLSEFRNNFTKGWHDMQSSTAKTSETLTSAGQKTSAAFSTLGTAITRKFGDMRSNSIGYSIRHSMSMPTMRNSPSFKSFEERVENTVSNIKTKVGGPGTGGSFEEVLSSAANATSQETPTNNLTDISERPC